VNSISMKKMADFITHVIEHNEDNYPECVVNSAAQVLKIRAEFVVELKGLDADEVFGRIGNLMYQATLDSDIMNIAPENLKPFAEKALTDLERRLVKALARVKQRLFIERMHLDCSDQTQNISISKEKFLDILKKITSPEMDIVDKEISLVAEYFK